MRKAVVLLSGGLDSTVSLAWAQSEGFHCYALSVDYGQRHRLELQQARRIAWERQVLEHRTIAIDLREIGGSALNSSAPVPKDRSAQDMATGIPPTYVPARNTVLLSVALSYAEVLGAWDIVFGANQLDQSGYPDCRPEFFRAFESFAGLATKQSVESSSRWKIHTPLIERTKTEVIQLGASLGVDFGATLSCYDPDDAGQACGRCDACQLRRQGFQAAGLADPTRYQQSFRTPTPTAPGTGAGTDDR